MRLVRDEVGCPLFKILCTRADRDVQESMDQAMRRGGRRESSKDMA